MAPSADNEPLGRKHKQFNKQVQDVINSGRPLAEKEFVKGKNDLENLMKIDVASHNQDFNYILSVLKSDDLLYVSRAIKQSKWLVDGQYAHIINPAYLNEHLFPLMKTKATIKLLKHIRQYLKEECRVEEFYENESDPKVASKWLSRCSTPFILKNVNKHTGHITNLELKRLCARSVEVFQTAMQDKDVTVTRKTMKAATFLLQTHPDIYLNAFEKWNKYYQPTLGPGATELIMKRAPHRVINNFLKYVQYIHIPTFLENIKRGQIKGLLLELANKEDERGYYGHYRLFCFETIKQFIKKMHKDEQFEFVKKVFLDKENIMKIEDNTLQRGTEMFAIKTICGKVCQSMPIYPWYEFAPFITAFEEIYKLMHTETDSNEKYSMLNVLLICAAENTTDLLTLLKYYFKISMNDDIEQKREFINKLLLQAEIYKKNEDTWNTFINIVNSMNINTNNDNQEYIQICMLHYLLLSNQVPETIEENFTFDTLKKYHKKLSQDGQNRVFEYMYNYMMKKIQGYKILTELEFSEAIQLVQHLLGLLLDWDKALSDYPFALVKIKELVRLKKDNAWKTSLSVLYNKKKSWRRLMFEESVVMNPSQKVCVNALKHDPSLLARYEDDVEAICCDDMLSLKQLHKKIRIYWPNTLADSWTKSYLGRLDKLGSQNALTRGLCILLSQEQLLAMIKEYAPAQPKVDWNNTNEITLGLQRYFAKNMHIARPQPTADFVLMYAKGDFLQYALPSLLAIYYNMGCVESQRNIPKLLNAPVSLQKHGLRLAFIKLSHEELKFHLTNIWQASKNISIRAVTFVLLFKLMSEEKDVTRAEELWEILEVFMDNLSFKEDKKIYLKLKKIQDVPETIRPKFLVKSYTFLKSLLPHLKSETENFKAHIHELAIYTRTIMDTMCPEFVAKIITEHVDANFFNVRSRDDMLGVISSYLLSAKDEGTQKNKYEKVLVPLIKRAMTQWNDMYEEKYVVKNNFQDLLIRLHHDLSNYVFVKKMINPIKFFKSIEKELDTLPLPQNYVIIRMWKLVVKLTELIEKIDNLVDCGLQVNSIIIPEFGEFCLAILKEDVKAHFSCIYVLFAKVLKIVLEDFFTAIESTQIYKALLSDKDFIQGYLVVLYMLSDKGYSLRRNEEYKAKENELTELIRSHSSVEVKMHYYCKYSNEESLGI